MPLPLRTTFPHALAGSERPLAGMWVCSGSPLVAEICAGSGLDWLLIDAEHSPNGLESILAQLQADYRIAAVLTVIGVGLWVVTFAVQRYVLHEDVQPDPERLDAPAP